VHYRDLGSIDYQEAWDLQEVLLKENLVSTHHHLLFCEHPHVYTLGKSGKDSHLLINAQSMDNLGISYYRINRGGDITYHGPGQITGYPIFDLEKFKSDIGWYLRTLEEVVIQLLATYGLKGGRIPGATGVWLDIDSPFPRKICALGVRCSRWVSMHGFALNVNTDLSYFSHIVPCGINDKGVTSLQAELGHSLDISEVKDKLKEMFAQEFDFQYSA
ncbi:UNVERIFIED_CONTAM: hypothetical protein GTU68_040522, partial [Idotea baltica]|nr:hypothetical protein [Idotea baltica]